MKKIALLCLVFFISAACLSMCSPAERQAFEKNRALWESQAIQHYRIHFTIGCNCPWRELMPLTVEVQDGEIVSMVASNAGDISNYLDTFRRHATIESLFELVDSSIAKVYKLAVQYDATYGFPTSTVIDPYRWITDDATGYYVTDFEVLP